MIAASPVTLADIQAAARRLEGQIERTPFRKSVTLSEITGATTWLKFENLQFTASFKERGAYNKLVNLTADEKSRGVIAMSAGNHAQGVAYHAKRLGIPAIVVMPKNTPFVKVKYTEGHGARVILEGRTLEESATFAASLAAKESLTFVHPYDDPLIIAGQGTVGLEMLEAVPALDCLVVPVGGGGLIGGIAVAAKALKPGIRVIGVEAELYPSLKTALDGTLRPCGGDTLAEGIAVAGIGKLTLPLVREHVDDIVLASEDALEHAVSLLLNIEKTLVEGAGAAGLARWREGFWRTGNSARARRPGSSRRKARGLRPGRGRSISAETHARAWIMGVPQAAAPRVSCSARNRRFSADCAQRNRPPTQSAAATAGRRPCGPWLHWLEERL